MVGFAEIVVAFDAVLIIVPFNFKVKLALADETPVILMFPPTFMVMGSSQGMYLGSNGGKVDTNGIFSISINGNIHIAVIRINLLNAVVAIGISENDTNFLNCFACRYAKKSSDIRNRELIFITTQWSGFCSRIGCSPSEFCVFPVRGAVA